VRRGCPINGAASWAYDIGHDRVRAHHVKRTRRRRSGGDFCIALTGQTAAGALISATLMIVPRVRVSTRIRRLYAVISARVAARHRTTVGAVAHLRASHRHIWHPYDGEEHRDSPPVAQFLKDSHLHAYSTV
jgi:hypothetical protein